LLKETTGAFDEARIHDLHITSQTCNGLSHAAAGVIEPVTNNYPHMHDIMIKLTFRGVKAKGFEVILIT